MDKPDYSKINIEAIDSAGIDPRLIRAVGERAVTTAFATAISAAADGDPKQCSTMVFGIVSALEEIVEGASIQKTLTDLGALHEVVRAIMARHEKESRERNH